MPARIVVVHDNPDFTKALVECLSPDVAAFDDPVKALDLLKEARTVEFLITRLAFDNRQPLGLSLARVTRSARPEVRVIFSGQPGHRQIARGLGEFLEEPVAATHVGMIVEWLRGIRAYDALAGVKQLISAPAISTLCLPCMAQSCTAFLSQRT